MRDNLTAIGFILDESGSMNSLRNDTIGGFNTFVEEQKKEAGDAIITTIAFDDRYRIIHDGADIKTLQLLTEKDYAPRGYTALLDAIGRTITEMGIKLAAMPEDERPAKVVIAITTDGEENASKEYSYNDIKNMITHQQEKYNWVFLFLGANIDAIGVAGSIGISAMYAATYTANSVGTDSVYASMSKGVSGVRGSTGVQGQSGVSLDGWKDDVK